MKTSETKVLHLPILVEQDEDNFFIVSCPVFKACHSYGATIDEALVNIKEVIDMCIEEEKEKASEIQPPYSFLALHRNLSGQQ
jgi:predicted RNase H-like HicB family nuclease